MTNKELQEILKQFPDDVEIDIDGERCYIDGKRVDLHNQIIYWEKKEYFEQQLHDTIS